MTTIVLPTAVAALDANLSALRRGSPAAAEQIAGVMARPDITFIEAASGVVTATMEEWTLEGLTSRALASKRDPWQEAERLLEGLETSATPVVVINGFGLGYHVAALARRMLRTGLIICFEPDATLLRAVLERVDHSEWMNRANLLLVTDASDEATLAEAVRGLEGVLAMGTRMIDHPASRARLGDQAGRFTQTFTRVMKAARTTVVTTMVQTEATFRNLTQNLDTYSTAGSIAPLLGALTGRPAVVVSAGPSLARNIAELARPGVRDAVAIIATQTTLKPLLAAGIKPHLVTALDFHEISCRFYEGLSAADVDGVTLVIEPKVNPAVPAAFPGRVLCAADPILDRLLGLELVRSMGGLPAGATVAHLAYYLARYLGCDPVLLVGQDLGFTDGQYYAAGAAIHDVWASELNEFNTLEMLEWQRIVRMRPLLRRLNDQQGRPIYTDEQMATYLVQFQRDFKADAERGLSVIDATEGGVAKQGATIEPLADALRRFTGAGGPSIDALLAGALSRGGADEPRKRRLAAVAERVRAVRRDVWRVAQGSREAKRLLREMLEHHQDQPRVNRLIEQVGRIRDEVLKVQPAFELVERLNQTGAFNRAKADRRINLGELPPLDRQREQIQRDLTNVVWLAESADTFGRILDDCVRAVEGGPKRTRDPIAAPPAADDPLPTRGGARREPRVIAVLAGEADNDALGAPRDLAAPVADGHNAFSLTLARLARTPGLSKIVVVSRRPERLRAIAGPATGRLEIDWVTATEGDGFGPEILAPARGFARDGWRGGLGNLTPHDEVLRPAATLDGLRRHDADVALVLGVDWCFVDPALAGQLVERFKEDPAGHRITFAQTAPGLAPVLIDRDLAGALCEKRALAGLYASIGGLLGYIPTNPSPDLLAKSMCVVVDPAVRDAPGRLIADHAADAAPVIEQLRAKGLDPLTADARAVADAAAAITTAPLREVRVEVLDAQGRMLTPEALTTALRALAARGRHLAVTLWASAGDPLDHARLADFIRLTREQLAPATIHVRTNLRADAAALERLLAAGPEVLSLDLIAEDAATYQALTGSDAFAQVRGNLQRVLAARRALPGGGHSPWVVPRLTRRDAVYGQIEHFFDQWNLLCGWAVIDPLPAPRPGERIAPLPLPKLARARRSARVAHVNAAGETRAD